VWEYNSGARGPVVPPGKYEVRLTVGTETQTAPFEVKLDPRVHVSEADLQQQFSMQEQIHAELNAVYDAVNQIQDVRSQVLGLKRRLPENASAKTITASADDLDKKLIAVRDEFVNLTISANEDSLAYPPQMDAKWAFLANDLGTADSAPTEAEQREFEKLKRQTAEMLNQWEGLQSHELADFRKLASENSISTIVVPPADRAAEAEGAEAH